jgi:hypothetical protein
MKLVDEAIHAYAAWLAEFTTGDLQSLNVMRLRDESEAARRKLEAAIRSAVDGVVAALPAGWKLVPVEPTRDMLLAVHDGPYGADEHAMTPDNEEYLADCYRAAVKAAPTPGVPGSVKEDGRG